MRIADVLRSKGSSVATVDPTATVAELISELATHNVGALPVVEATSCGDCTTPARSCSMPGSGTS